MKIAILDYYERAVDVIDATDMAHADEIEEYLDGLGYHLEQISWMNDVKSINVQL